MLTVYSEEASKLREVSACKGDRTDIVQLVIMAGCKGKAWIFASGLRLQT